MDLITGIVKSNLEHYGDHLVNLYQKVKVGGALQTTEREKAALFNITDQYQLIRGEKDQPIDELSFTRIFNKLNQNTALRQMVQWGGGGAVKPKKLVVSKRLHPIYLDYLDYKSSQLSTTGIDRFSGSS